MSWCSSFLRSVLWCDVYFVDDTLVTCVLVTSARVCVCVRALFSQPFSNTAKCE
jgi:hypothetical protein